MYSPLTGICEVNFNTVSSIAVSIMAGGYSTSTGVSSSPSMTRFTMSFKEIVLTPSLTYRLNHADSDVVILCPNRIDFREACKKILHYAEAIVSVPVCEFVVQYIDVTSF